MRRSVKRILLLMMAAVLMMALTVPASAEGGYTVTVYTGARGSINGGDRYVIEDVVYGTRLDLTDYSGMSSLQIGGAATTETGGAAAASSTEKFCVRPGAKLAGSDNNDTWANYEITGDTDFVLVYYVPGAICNYTVYYRDRNGRDLAEPTYGSGGEGTRLTVGSKDIDGYEPNAYNLVRTLSENDADNVYTFVYTPKAPVTPQVIILPGDGGNGGGNGAAGGGNGAAGGGANANAGAGANNINGAAAEAEAEAVEETAPEGPVEIIDLDEEEVPLANIEGDNLKDKDKGKMEKPLLFGGLALSCGLLAAIIYIILSKKEEKEEE